MSQPEVVGPAAVDVSVSPIPTAGRVTIRYRIDQAARVTLDVFDVTGRRIRRLSAGPMAAGTHDAVWDGRSQDGQLAASGTYFVRAASGRRPIWRRLVLVR